MQALAANTPSTFSVPFATSLSGPSHAAPSPTSPYHSHSYLLAPVFPLSSAASPASVAAAAAALIHQPTPVYHPSFPSPANGGPQQAQQAAGGAQQSPMPSLVMGVQAGTPLPSTPSYFTAEQANAALFTMPSWPVPPSSAHAAAAAASSPNHTGNHSLLTRSPNPAFSAPASSSPAPSVAFDPSSSDDLTDQSQYRKRKKSKHGEKVQRKVACMLCHQAKTVCIGGRPCQRCRRLHKADQCVDRVTSFRKGGAGKGEGGEDGGGDSGSGGEERVGGVEKGGNGGGSHAAAGASLHATSLSPALPSPPPAPQSAQAGPGDSNEWWELLPALYSSAFFLSVVHPERSYPTVTQHTAAKMGLHLIAQYNRQLPMRVYIELLKEMGYRELEESKQKQHKQIQAEDAIDGTAVTTAGDANSTGADDINGTDDKAEPDMAEEAKDEALAVNAFGERAERNTYWRSSHPHLPDLILPLTRRFNYHHSPTTALKETTITTRLPSLIIERGDFTLPEPTTHRPPFPAPPRTLVNDIELPVSVLVNAEFEHMFGYTQAELKILFQRHGRWAMDRLTVGTEGRIGRLTIRSMIEGQTEQAEEVTIWNKWKNQIRVIEHRKVTLDEVSWFKRVVFTWVPFTRG